MINLDYQSRTPIYEQIVKEIERYIVLGILKPNEQISSIRELATNLGINPNTVKKAYEELEKRGTIITISTKGTFVAAKTEAVFKRKITEKIELIKQEINELEKMGVTKEEILKNISKMKLSIDTKCQNVCNVELPA